MIRFTIIFKSTKANVAKRSIVNTGLLFEDAVLLSGSVEEIDGIRRPVLGCAAGGEENPLPPTSIEYQIKNTNMPRPKGARIAVHARTIKITAHFMNVRHRPPADCRNHQFRTNDHYTLFHLESSRPLYSSPILLQFHCYSY